MNATSLLAIATCVARERELETVLQRIVVELAGQKGVALTRIWLLGEGDRCQVCSARDQCPTQTRCLHLAASAAPRLPTGRRPIGLGSTARCSASRWVWAKSAHRRHGRGGSVRRRRRRRQWIFDQRWVSPRRLSVLPVIPWNFAVRFWACWPFLAGTARTVGLRLASGLRRPRGDRDRQRPGLRRDRTAAAAAGGGKPLSARRGEGRAGLARLSGRVRRSANCRSRSRWSLRPKRVCWCWANRDRQGTGRPGDPRAQWPLGPRWSKSTARQSAQSVRERVFRAR